MSGPDRDDDEAIDEFHLDAIADADPYPYWYDDADEPDSNPTLVRSESCDLCIVGGGYTGLWTAIIAKERDPNRDVVLIDAHEIGSAASGRNGGFMESSLTHGVANGQERFPQELPLLEELGLQNLNEIEAAIRRYGIDCDYERTGVIDVATGAHSSSYLDSGGDFILRRIVGDAEDDLVLLREQSGLFRDHRRQDGVVVAGDGVGHYAASFSAKRALIASTASLVRTRVLRRSTS